MIKINGNTVSDGCTFGQIHFIKPKNNDVAKKTVLNTDLEIIKVDAAITSAVSELSNLYEKVSEKAGKSVAEIFNIQKMMLEDNDYLSHIKNLIISEKVCAEYAVSKTGVVFSEMFSLMEDTYMKERSKDVLDVSHRLISILESNKQDDISTLSGIIAAEDLMPSQTVLLDKKSVSAFITKKGSKNSHTAILARSMNIPAIVSLGDELLEEYDGHYAAIDGPKGVVYIDPTPEIIQHICKEIEKSKENIALYQTYVGLPTVTTGGKKINLFSNVGSLSEIDEALKNDAEGIGLFRSELIYISQSTLPTEEQQFEIYKQAALKLAGKKLIIRTLDIGADKCASYLDTEKEDNPAMGLRGIRFCLKYEDIFKKQIRAILRASAYGNVSIMLPMITEKEEVLMSLKIIEEVKFDLKKLNISYKEDIETGIMIETPSAALLCDELATVCDFFSIGTNDLTQYTLAADRQNSQLYSYFNKPSSAVLKLIASVGKCAEEHGIWAGVCGEMAADPDLTPFFISSGITELSVSPPYTLKLRKKIRSM